MCWFHGAWYVVVDVSPPVNKSNMIKIAEMLTIFEKFVS